MINNGRLPVRFATPGSWPGIEDRRDKALQFLPAFEANATPGGNVLGAAGYYP